MMKFIIFFLIHFSVYGMPTSPKLQVVLLINPENLEKINQTCGVTPTKKIGPVFVVDTFAQARAICQMDPTDEQLKKNLDECIADDVYLKDLQKKFPDIAQQLIQEPNGWLKPLMQKITPLEAMLEAIEGKTSTDFQNFYFNAAGAIYLQELQKQLTPFLAKNTPLPEKKEQFVSHLLLLTTFLHELKHLCFQQDPLLTRPLSPAWFFHVYLDIKDDLHGQMEELFQAKKEDSLWILNFINNKFNGFERVQENDVAPLKRLQKKLLPIRFKCRFAFLTQTNYESFVTYHFSSCGTQRQVALKKNRLSVFPAFSNVAFFIIKQSAISDFLRPFYEELDDIVLGKMACFGRLSQLPYEATAFEQYFRTQDNFVKESIEVSNAYKAYLSGNLLFDIFQEQFDDFSDKIVAATYWKWKKRKKQQVFSLK